MKKILGIIILVLLLFGAVLSYFDVPSTLWFSFMDYLVGLDREFGYKMESVKKGMIKTEVINLLGEPHMLTNGPSDEADCFFYNNGIDSWSTYCFDENDKVSLANYVGGT